MYAILESRDNSSSTSSTSYSSTSTIGAKIITNSIVGFLIIIYTGPRNPILIIKEGPYSSTNNRGADSGKPLQSQTPRACKASISDKRRMPKILRYSPCLWGLGVGVWGFGVWGLGS